MKISDTQKNNLAGLRGTGSMGQIAIGVSTCVALWFIAALFLGDGVLPIRWLNYAGPWLGLIALCTCVPAVIGKRWITAALQALLAVLVLAPIADRFWPGRLWNASDPGDLRVVTFNVTDFNPNTLGGTYRNAATAIGDLHPDIVFLQQIMDGDQLITTFARNPELKNLHPFPAPGSKDFVGAQDFIFSRYILEDARAPFDRAASAHVRVGKCRIELWGLHAPHGERDIRPQVEFFGDFIAGADSGDATTVAAGDMNSTEFNSVQDDVRRSFHDAFAEKGFGFGFTYPTRVRRLGLFGPFVQIDHIFFRGHIAPTESHVFGGSAGSDHFGMFAAFRIDPACKGS
jgi:vancomycin resistance protein VanJ